VPQPRVDLERSSHDCKENELRVSIHNDVLTELAERVLNEGSKSVELYLATNGAEYWSPATSFADAHKVITAKYGADAASFCLRTIKNFVGCVPFRNSTLDAALKLGDVEAAGHVSARQLIDIDAILTRSPDTLAIDGVSCVTPEELWGLSGRKPATTNVPFVDLKAQYSKIYNEIDDRFTEVISETGFILGKHVEEFEAAFADLQGARYCVGMSSGTAALHAAFMALDIGPGDEVLVPVNTFFATAEAVSLLGATPVFVDSDSYFNIDVHRAREILKTRRGSVKAIAPVHLYGQSADLDAIVALAQEFEIRIVEDCAQAHLAEYKGRKIGNDGEFGAFSFYPGKNLGAFGEAGAVITNDKGLYEKARMIRAHGEAERYSHSLVGQNYRMPALQGAVLATKCRYISGWTDCRRRNAGLYRKHLANVGEIRLPEEREFSNGVYHLFVIEADNRDGLRSYLGEAGISTGLHYPVPLHLQEAYAELGYAVGDFPNAERQASRILSLPMYPELDERDIRYVCDSIMDYVATHGARKIWAKNIKPSLTTSLSAKTFESTTSSTSTVAR
jgi:dTDP-4-amino-4,6-dideoxygalactose transaminase